MYILYVVFFQDSAHIVLTLCFLSTVLMFSMFQDGPDVVCFCQDSADDIVFFTGRWGHCVISGRW